MDRVTSQLPLDIGDMKASIIRLSDLGSQEIENWQEWRAKDAAYGSPFLSPEFALAYGRHNDRARVAVFEDGNKVVGFLPFEQHKMRVAKALAHGLADVQGAIVAPDVEIPVTKLLESSGFEVFEFDRLLTSQTTHDTKLEASPVIDLSEGFESWLAAKKKASKSRFKRILQRERQIERELGQINFTFESHNTADLEQLMTWKSDQYIRTGRRDRFACAWFRNFMFDLFENSSDELSVVLSTLAVDDRTLAVDMGLRSGSTLAGWFPAYDRTLVQYSLGTVCLMKQLEAAAKSGVVRFDLGPGEADYKNAFMTHEDQLASGRVAQRTPLAMVRRAQTVPSEALEQFVLSRPELRSAARYTLSAFGSVRKKIRDSVVRHPAFFPSIAVFEGMPTGL